MSITIDRVTKFTVDAYHRMIEAGILADRQVELLNGVIIDMPPEGPSHAHYSDQAGRYLTRLLGDRAWVRQAKPITLRANNSEPEPDLSIVEPLIYAERHPYPSDIFWVVEYSKTSLESDKEEKRRTYASASIREFWIADLVNCELLVYQGPAQGDYRTKLTFEAGQEISPLAFPDLSISVSQLLPPH